MCLCGLESFESDLCRLGRRVRAALVRAIDMRVIVRIADSDVEHLDTCVNEARNKHIRLGQIHLAIGIRAEAVWICHHIADSEARYHGKIIAHRRLDGSYRVEIKPGSVLKRAAVTSLSRKRREKLLEEIAVTALDVHTVKADLPRKPRGLRIKGRKRIKIFISHDVRIGHRAARLIGRISVSYHRYDALPARVSQLKYHKGLDAALLARDSAHVTKERPEHLFILLGESHLTGIRSALGAYGAGLKPNNADAGACGVHIFRDGQLARSAVLRTITALHRLKDRSVLYDLVFKFELAPQHSSHPFQSIGFFMTQF